MSALPGTRPTGPAIAAAKVAGGPEVSAAASVAQSRAKAGSGKAGGGAGRRRRPITGDMSPAQVNAELQARRSAASTPGQPAESPPAGPATTTPPPAPSAPPSPGGGLSMPALTGTGGGFLLGLGAWALGLAYLRGGAPEVRKLLAAKFLNRTQ